MSISSPFLIHSLLLRLPPYICNMSLNSIGCLPLLLVIGIPPSPHSFDLNCLDCKVLPWPCPQLITLNLMAKLRLLIRVSSNTWGPLLLTNHINGLSGYPWQNSGSTRTSTLVWSWHHLKHSMFLPFPPCKVTFLALLELMPWIFFCAKGMLFWLLSRHTLLLHRRGWSFKQTSTVKTCPLMWEIGFT